jgi:hypothetical protein
MKMKKLLMMALMISGFLPLAGYGYVWEGFEKENLWFISVAKDNTIDAITLSTQEKTEGKQSLAIDTDKCDWAKKGVLSREGSMDFSQVKSIQCDIYSEKSIGVSMGITTGEDFVWYESENVKLKRGWNKDVTFNLASSKWKSAATSWEATAKLDNAGNVKKLAYIFNSGDKQRLYIDNVRFDGGKVDNEATLMPSEPFDSSKLVDDYKLLDGMSADGWAKDQSPGVTNEKGSLRVLKFEKIDNSAKAAYKSQMDMDWKEYGKLIIRFRNNSAEYVCPALGVQSGDGWTWLESPVFLVKPSATSEVTFNLNAPYYKSEGSGWKYNSYLLGKDNIKSMHILLYGIFGKKGSGSVTIESVQFLKCAAFVPVAK